MFRKIIKEEQTELTLQSYNNKLFDTHVRIFLNFIYLNKINTKDFTDLCQKEQNSKHPICVTWSMFNTISFYLTNSVSSETIRNNIVNNPQYKFDQPLFIMSLISALESAY